MTTLFIRIYRYLSTHRLVGWTLLVALFAVLVVLASRLHLEEDINKLMPSSRNEDGSTKLAFADLRIKDKTFVLFENDGQADTETLAAACDEFVDSLLAHDTDSVVGDVFYRLDDDLMPDVIGYLTEHFPAYIDSTLYDGIDTLLTRQHMAAQMQQNREDMESEVGEMFPELIQMDPIGLRNLMSAKGIGDMAGNYLTIDNHFFVRDSSVCVAFITPRFSATNTGQGSALFQRMNTLIDSMAVSQPHVRISYHGTPASGYYNSTVIKHDLTTTIASSVVLVLLFIILCFRRWDTLPLLLLPVAFGALFGMAVMYLLRGQFSLLALGIGGVVLGVAFSYVLHVLTHHQYESDAEQLLRDQTKPLLLGCITTIGSFGGLFFTRTDLLQDFGLFAALAIAATTLFSLAFLPFLLSRGKERKAKKNKAFTVINSINSYPVDRNRWAIGLLLLVMVVCIGAYVWRGTQFDGDMHNLGYEAAMVEHSEQTLRDKTYTGDKEKYFASSGKTMEEAISRFALLEQKLDSLKQLGLVKSYTPTNHIFVSLEQQQRNIDRWQQFWTPERLQRVRQLVNETAPSAGLVASAFEPFFESATAQYEPDALYEAGIIPAGFQSTLMERSYNGDYLCFTSVRCENDSVRSANSAYNRICDAICSQPHLMVLDTYYYTTDTLQQLNSDFSILQWLSMAFVFVVLLVSFRFNLQHTILGFAPILLSWLIVLGVMAIFGVQFNLINIIISTFIFGIGVDYSIFVMSGLTTDVGERLLLEHKSAIFFSVVVLVVTVGSMLLAVHPAIRSVGFATLVGLLAAVLLSYVLQPAVYRWLNRKKR